jgi:hypothetical protein
MTIASSVETEEDLVEREKRHVCPEKALAMLLALEKSMSAGCECGKQHHPN